MDDIPSMEEEEVREQAPGWYERWRERIYTWVSKHSDESIAGILLLMPDLFALLARLATDRRVPFLVKGQLLLATAYVISPFDLIPEAITGVIGLAEDAGVMALTLLWIKNIVGIDNQILRDNWAGDDDPEEVIDRLHQKVIDNADTLFEGDVWEKIQNRFRHKEAEVVEGEAVQVHSEPAPEPKKRRWGFRRQQQPDPPRRQKIEITT
jgi:uncharacterized membrane protein YkvA (DUF1232 family)